MKKRLLTITDCTDLAANELHATLVSCLDKLDADNVIVEPIVGVQQFSITQAAFASRLLAESYIPEQLTILVVVNPLNTADVKRARIAGKLGNGIQIVGANTGVFSWLIKDFGLTDLCETDDTGLKGDGFISFGGKYIHAPIAAKLAATGKLEVVKVRDFPRGDMLELEMDVGKVVHIDNFGVPKINITASNLGAIAGDKFALQVNGEHKGIVTYCNSMKELTDDSLALYKGSSLGLLEIGIVRRTDAAEFLKIDINDIVSLELLAD